MLGIRRRASCGKRAMAVLKELRDLSASMGFYTADNPEPMNKEIEAYVRDRSNGLMAAIEKFEKRQELLFKSDLQRE